LQEARLQIIKRLYFISRDGYILQQIAENLPHEGIELRYYFTSRKALQKALENKDEHKLIMQYFKQEGLMDDCRCAMVDVGWLGTSRKMINQILKAEGIAPIHFFYFGTTKNVLSKEYGSFQSFLPAGFLPYYMQLLVEHYFSASPYPTTLGYQHLHNDLVAPVFPNDEHYCESKIVKTNVEVCKQMAEAFLKVGTPSADVLRQWTEKSMNILAHDFIFADFSPLMDLPKFDGQDFVRKLKLTELLLMTLTGQHITVFDKGSLAMTFNNLRIQRILWSLHCQTGNLRSWLYHLYQR
jgi:hypothetical protein